MKLSAELTAFIEERLSTLLSCRPCVVVGCTRQNVWAPLSTWRYARGNALLLALGARYEFHPLGGFTGSVLFWDNGVHLLQYRGGYWKEWWEEDCQDLLSILNTVDVDEMKGAVVLVEVDSVIALYYVPTPPPDEARRRRTEAEHRYTTAYTDAPARIRKDSPRGLAICRHCPVKKRCDALDMVEGNTSDWPKGYIPG